MTPNPIPTKRNCNTQPSFYNLISVYLAAAIIGAMLVLFSGCGDAGTTRVGAASAEANTTTPTNAVAEQPNGVQADQREAQQSDAAQVDTGLMEQAGKFFNGIPSAADNSRKWIGQKLNDGVNVTGETAQDAMNWATESFQSLKSQGLTTANDATSWLNEDWKNMNAFEYKVLTVDSAADPQDLEGQLNRLGAARWECFHAQPTNNGSMLLMFKKPKRSYLKALPVRDLIRLVPLMGSSDSQ